MCNAFSGICLESGKVIWKLGVDSHRRLLDDNRIKDTSATPNFAPFEITRKT